jgi:hypothetical protein
LLRDEELVFETAFTIHEQAKRQSASLAEGLGFLVGNSFVGHTSSRSLSGDDRSLSEAARSVKAEQG